MAYGSISRYKLNQNVPYTSKPREEYIHSIQKCYVVTQSMGKRIGNMKGGAPKPQNTREYKGTT